MRFMYICSITVFFFRVTGLLRGLAASLGVEYPYLKASLFIVFRPCQGIPISYIGISRLPFAVSTCLSKMAVTHPVVSQRDGFFRQVSAGVGYL